MLGKDAFVVINTYDLGSRADAIEVALTKSFTIGCKAVTASDRSGKNISPTVLHTIVVEG